MGTLQLLAKGSLHAHFVGGIEAPEAVAAVVVLAISHFSCSHRLIGHP